MSNQPLSLKSHDVCVALQVLLQPEFTFRELSAGVGLSLGESHNSVQRLSVAGLLLPHRHDVNRAALVEFVLHGVPYAFPGELGPESRGVPTAHSAPALEGWVSDAEPVVWPHLDGERRGASLAPLCHNAPSIVHSNPELYRWLTLVDALRVGRARERSRAKELLEEELLSGAAS